MKAHIMTGTGTINGGPEGTQPWDVDYEGAGFETYQNSNYPLSQDLPPGTNATSENALSTNGFDAQSAVQWFNTSAKLLDQFERSANIQFTTPSGFDIPACVALIGTAAGIGFMAGGPVGALIGAIAGLVLYVVSFFVRNSVNPNFANATVRDWAYANAEEAFINSAIAEQNNGWTTVDQIAKHQLAWWLETYKAVLVNNGGRFYSNKPDTLYIIAAGGEAAVAELYKQATVDYYATKAVRAENNTTAYNMVVQYRYNYQMPNGEQLDDTQSTTTTNNFLPLLFGGAAVLYLSNKR